MYAISYGLIPFVAWLHKNAEKFSLTLSRRLPYVSIIQIIVIVICKFSGCRCRSESRLSFHMFSFDVLHNTMGCKRSQGGRVPGVNQEHLNTLEKKCIENLSCALWADKESKRNVAISRFYYSCLLITKRCLLEKGWITQEQIDNAKKGSHNEIINTYKAKQLAIAELPFHYLPVISYLEALKEPRVKAEYHADKDYTCAVNNADYDSCKNKALKYIEAIEEMHNLKIRDKV